MDRGSQVTRSWEGYGPSSLFNKSGWGTCRIPGEKEGYSGGYSEGYMVLHKGSLKFSLTFLPSKGFHPSSLQLLRTQITPQSRLEADVFVLSYL